MELKLTTKRALAYEAKTGHDIMQKCQEISKTGEVSLKDVVDLFEAMGDGYTVDDFDNWDASFVDKATAIFNAVTEFVQGSKK